MTQALLDAGNIAERDYESLVTVVLKREELGTTVTSAGVAVVHAKHPGIQRIMGTAAVCRPSVNFSGRGGKTAHSVRFVILLISPLDRRVDYLKALSWIERKLQDDAFCRSLTRARAAKEVIDLLDKADKRQYS